MNSIKPGTDGCLGPDECLRVISGIGTPALWWAAIIALIAAAILWVGARDWRLEFPWSACWPAGCRGSAIRTDPLFFYAIAFLPFSVMAVALCLDAFSAQPEQATGEWWAQSWWASTSFWSRPTSPISTRY